MTAEVSDCGSEGSLPGAMLVEVVSPGPVAWKSPGLVGDADSGPTTDPSRQPWARALPGGDPERQDLGRAGRLEPLRDGFSLPS